MSNNEKDVVSSTAESESTVKRRGRPRKSSVAEQAIEQTQTMPEKVEAEPKKRGRKPKAASDESVQVIQKSLIDDGGAPEEIKSKRGRPAKVKANENVESSSEHKAEVESQPTRGRRRVAPKTEMQTATLADDNISIVANNTFTQNDNITQVNSSNQSRFQDSSKAHKQENEQPKHHNKKTRNDNRNARAKFSQPQYSNSNEPNNFSNDYEYSQNNYDYSYNQQRNPRQRSPKNFSQKNRAPKQVNNAYNDVAFDNSSIIAAITGKNLNHDYDMYANAGYDSDVSYEQMQNNNLKNYDNRNKSRGGNYKNKLNQKKTRNQNAGPKAPTQDFHSDDSLISQFKSYGTKSSQQFDTAPHYSNDNYNSNEPPLAIENKSKNILSLPSSDEQHVETNQQNGKNYRNTFSAAEELHGQPQKSNYSQNLKMYIGVQPDEQIEIALADNKVIVEYFVEMSHQAKIRGNIYKGVIHNVDPNLQAVFVNFGAERNGFLQIDEVHPDYYLSPHTPNKTHKFPLISKVLRPGQEILVQIVKEPTGTKGAFLTTWISLAGRYLVLTPGQEQIGVSRKVTDQEERARLRDLLEGIDPGEDMGIIIRTAAANASREEIEADLEYLQNLWVDIVEKANNSSSHAIIHQEVDLAERVMRDYLTENIKEIWTDDSAMAERMNEITKQSYPQKRKIVKLHSDPRQSLWERFNLQTQIDEITSREVSLPSGGRVAFDQTEALMAIDINSGKTQNKASFHSMVLQTNIEAAQAIARHLRLRDIGGQVVIDFIELRDKSSIREVEKAFHEAMRPDRARYEIGSISPFGLLEVVRQRIGSSAISISSEPCPHCKGTGVRRNMEWQAQDVLKEIARKARAEKTIKYTHVAEKELALYLLNTKRDRIQEIEEQLNKRIEIVI